MSTILRGLYSNIPDPVSATGSYYFAVDQHKYYLANGNEWIESTPSDDNTSPVLGSSGVDQVEDHNSGSVGATFIEGEATYEDGPWYAIHMIEDVNFYYLDSNWNYSPDQNTTFKAGTVIYGIFNSIYQATGRSIAYRK